MGETIALIGCGAGNAALVAHLAASGWEEIDELYLIDPRIPARGTAFDHDEEYLLCNTSVAVNSVFPDDSSHFLRWLHADTSHPPQWGVTVDSISLHSFVPRGLFMEYVGAQFHDAIESATANGALVKHVASRAISIERTTDAVAVTTASGQRLRAHRAVIATGLQDSAGTQRRRRSAGENLLSAYDRGLIERLERSQSVLILGMHQSAIDMAQLVQEANPNAEIVMASRSGRLPGVRTEMIEQPSEYVTPRAILAPDGPGAAGTPTRWTATLAHALRYEGGDGTGCSAIPPTKTNPIAQLQADLAHTRDGWRAWQRIDRNAVTVANAVWPTLDRAHRQMFRRWFADLAQRYVSSIPDIIADRLLASYDSGQLRCARILDDPCFSSTFVDAYTDLGAVRCDIAIDATGKEPEKIAEPDSDRIFALGPADNGTLAIPNYFNATARRAAKLARTLTAHGRSTRLEGHLT